MNLIDVAVAGVLDPGLRGIPVAARGLGRRTPTRLRESRGGEARNR